MKLEKKGEMKGDERWKEGRKFGKRKGSNEGRKVRGEGGMDGIRERGRGKKRR